MWQIIYIVMIAAKPGQKMSGSSKQSASDRYEVWYALLDFVRNNVSEKYAVIPMIATNQADQ